MKNILLFLIILISTDVLAFEKNTNFAFEKFEKAQQEGKTIVINAWNETCMTCAKQSKVFANAVNDFKNVEFFFMNKISTKNLQKH